MFSGFLIELIFFKSKINYNFQKISFPNYYQNYIQKQVVTYLFNNFEFILLFNIT